MDSLLAGAEIMSEGLKRKYEFTGETMEWYGHIAVCDDSVVSTDVKIGD